MALLDVNALVALAWDSHVHHASIRTGFAANSSAGWATCPLTESGFVRVSSNRKVLPSAIGIDAARAVLTALRAAEGHRFSRTTYRSAMTTSRRSMAVGR
jgi:toxin-antitoxin system PIN domain toxin